MRRIEIDPSMMFGLSMCVNNFLGQILMHIYIYGIKKEINAFMRIFCNLKNWKMAHSLSLFLPSIPHGCYLFYSHPASHCYKAIKLQSHIYESDMILPQ